MEKCECHLLISNALRHDIYYSCTFSWITRMAVT
jgi:hypothetical protein